MADPLDILVIGGGINGAGIARDAAGRGLKVMLCEKGGLASATSSASTKLIHGGLRYLEYYEFRLVREALIERETLLNAAPHIIWPLRFVLPHHKELRPRWMLRAGLFLYDHIGGRKKLPPTSSVNFHNDPRGAPLDPSFARGYEYSDCWVDDARLVCLNAVDAKAHGADIRTRTRVISLREENGMWVSKIRRESGEEETVFARSVVNAAGGWVNDILQNVVGRNAPARFQLRLVKGSHLIVKRHFEGSQAYIFQGGDGRIIFAIPYEKNYTLIGTTDQPYDGDPGAVSISEDEIDYLCRTASEYFKTPILRENVCATYAGVRPLYDDMSSKDAAAVTRDYVFDIDGRPPILSIYGGKITTYRKLAEHALEKLSDYFPDIGAPWTKNAPLPGGEIANADFELFYEQACDRFLWMEPAYLLRLARAYGARVENILDGAHEFSDLGRHYGEGLTDAELRYLSENEFAQCAEDVLKRCSKLYLHLSQTQQKQVAEFFA